MKDIRPLPGAMMLELNLSESKEIIGWKL